jgi:hypothetical protein
MERPEIDCTNHFLTIELSRELYVALLEKVKVTGKTESDLVVQGLQWVVDKFNENELNIDSQDRFSDLEASLEKKLKQYVEDLINDRLAALEFDDRLSKPNRATDRTPEEKIKSNMPIPTIRPLQVGDRVMILEPDSPYYMAKLSVIRTSLIRATVLTETGEKTFLKRDLRFVESASE